MLPPLEEDTPVPLASSSAFEAAVRSALFHAGRTSSASIESRTAVCSFASAVHHWLIGLHTFAVKSRGRCPEAA